MVHVYFWTFAEVKFTSTMLLSLKRNTLFRKSTSNILLILNILKSIDLLNLLQVYL